MAEAIISQSQAKFLAKGWEKAKTRIAHLRESSEKVMDASFQVAETGLTAGALGLVNGMWGGAEGEVRLLGVPVDMLVGGLVGGAVIAGGFGSQSQHGVNIFAGTVASFMGRLGQRTGATWAAQSQQQHALPQGANPPVFNGAPAGAAYANPYPAGYPAAHQ